MEDIVSCETIAEKFWRIFSGLSRAYGTYNVTITQDQGKQVGGDRDIKTLRGDVNPALWELHLAGKQRIGIVPIRDGNDCVFGAIDIDQYKGALDHRTLVKKLARFAIPLAVCRSKSGGAHLYCFAKSPVSAGTMKAKLSEVAAFLGFGGSEIFPKQTQLLTEKGDVGQWINMPYFGGTRGMCYCVDPEGNAMSLDQFTEFAQEIAVDPSWFSQLLIMEKSFEDGPPCLQALAQIGVPNGSRNDGLFNIGVYLRKAYPDSWQQEIESYNHRMMDPPLAGPEIQGVVKSLSRKDYTYTCRKQPIVQYCNATLCRTRKFGVTSGASVKFPLLGGLTKLSTKPPIWFWTVDGHRIELTTQEIQEPKLFQRRCMEVGNSMPTMPPPPVWQAAVQQAMDNVTIIEASLDSSPEGQFWELMEKFLCGRAQGQSLEEIIMGKPYTDLEGTTYFRLGDFVSFLVRHQFKEYSRPKISSILRDSGAQHHVQNFKGRGTNYWSIKSMFRQTEGFSVPKNITDSEGVF